MSATTKSISALQMSVRYGIAENTDRLFMHKVREAMKSSQSNGMKGTVYVDEFTVVEKEENKPGRSYNVKKKKVICAVEVTEDGKIKRFYAQKINDFSSKSLRSIFENISINQLMLLPINGKLQTNKRIQYQANT